MFEGLVIQSPKRSVRADARTSCWYPYYAGFSTTFASSLLASAGLSSETWILDSWNGSGTTTSAAAALGYGSLGYDLNPVMVVIAKARSLNKREKASLAPIAADIRKKAVRHRGPVPIECDPLLAWLQPSSVAIIRKLEMAIQLLLVETNTYQLVAKRETLDELSDLAAFFYTALFRTVRNLLAPFFASNPTWIKKAQSPNERVRPSIETILLNFELEIQKMIGAMNGGLFADVSVEGERSIAVASSHSLPVLSKSIDFVLSSPPYCTRIDYAVATLLELAILGYDESGNLRSLREKLIGTSTISAVTPQPQAVWGAVCNEFLEGLGNHSSKASRSYYWKNHVQYFDGIHRSLQEIARALKPSGGCVLVIQDSYYKEIHNDLPAIITEMADGLQMSLRRRDDFVLGRTMAGINPAARKYRSESKATESVLCFEKA